MLALIVPGVIGFLLSLTGQGAMLLNMAGLWGLAVFAAFMLYFGLYSRHHLVASSPDEEFAALARAEAELE